MTLTFSAAPACPRPQYTVIRPEYNAKALEYATEEEKKKLAELQERIAEDYPVEREDVFWLLKFLRARRLDVSKAEQLFRERMRFVETEQPHLIDPENEPEVAHELSQVRCFLYGRDKRGRPIVNIRSGLTFVTRPSEASRRAILYMVEKTMSELPPPPHDQYVIVLNRRNSSLLKPRDTTMSKSGNFYPETLKYMFFINASWTFNMMMKIVSLFVDKKTADKIIALSDPTELLQHIEPQQMLPDVLAQCRGHMPSSTANAAAAATTTATTTTTTTGPGTGNQKRLDYWPPWSDAARIFAETDLMGEDGERGGGGAIVRQPSVEEQAEMDPQVKAALEMDEETTEDATLDLD